MVNPAQWRIAKPLGITLSELFQSGMTRAVVPAVAGHRLACRPLFPVNLWPVPYVVGLCGLMLLLGSSQMSYVAQTREMHTCHA